MDYWTGLQDLKSGLAGLQKGKGLGNSRRLGGEWIQIWRWELIWTCHILGRIVHRYRKWICIRCRGELIHCLSEKGFGTIGTGLAKRWKPLSPDCMGKEFAHKGFAPVICDWRPLGNVGKGLDDCWVAPGIAVNWSCRKPVGWGWA